MTDRWQQTWRKHRRALIGAGLGFGLLALLIFLAQDPETLRVESPVAASDSRFPEYVASLIGTPVHRGDAYTILHDGDETYPAMLDAIEHAKSRISFETYVFKDGDIGDRFVDAMARAAQRGVTVRVVIDPI